MHTSRRAHPGKARGHNVRRFCRLVRRGPTTLSVPHPPAVRGLARRLGAARVPTGPHALDSHGRVLATMREEHQSKIAGRAHHEPLDPEDHVLGLPLTCVLLFLLVTLLGCSTTSTSAPTGHGSTPRSSLTMAAKITSTLDGMSVLPHRVHWEATPADVPAGVSEVDFLIDSQLAWTEKKAPYSYGDDGNWLVTSFLAPGRHQFETRLVALDGQTVTDTVTAIVGKATPPRTSMSGKWERTVSSADTSKATSGEPPPTGRWTLTINDVGWKVGDPQGSGILNDVAYLAPGRLLMRPTIEIPPFPNDGNGSFCHEPDPEWAWTYVLSNQGKTMRLAPVGVDPCGDRAAIYQGTWTRTSD